METPVYEPPGIGDQGTPKTQTVESRVLSVINSVQRHEGQPVDPWLLSEELTLYGERVGSTLYTSRGIQSPREGIETQTPEEREELDTIKQVRDALDISAYPHYTPGQQKLISDEVHAFHKKTLDSFTLTPQQKSILQTLAKAAGVADNPDQLTYSFSSIPPAPKIVRGSTG